MGKCKFHKKCEKFKSNSVTCTQTGGMYYSSERGAGCYKKMENK